MDAIYPNPSQSRPMFFKINRAARLRFNLMENGVDVTNTTGWTWRLCLRRYGGDRKNIWCLTLNNGLRYEIYTDYTLIADITAAQNNIEEGDYFLELERTDLAKTWFESRAKFTYENP